MPSHLRIAIFGVTPLSLILGQACSLSDCPPIGLYDPDAKQALRGSLFLDVSARKSALQLSPAKAPLELVLLAHPQALPELQTIDLNGILIIQLYKDKEASKNWCQAVPIVEQPDKDLSIEFSLPNLCFELSGAPQALKKGAAFLRSLSPQFNCLEL